MQKDLHRFTDRARKIMQLANHEAKQLKHEYIGTEHILLGVVIEGSGVGCLVLKNLGVTPDRVRREILRLMQSGLEPVLAKSLPKTPRAKSVIDFALQEADALRHDYVGSEHILLGLLREHEGVAARVLFNLGVTPDAARQALIEILGSGTGNPGKPALPGAPLVAALPLQWKPGETPLPPPPEFLAAGSSSTIRTLTLALLLVSLAVNLVLGVLLYLAFTVR